MKTRCIILLIFTISLIGCSNKKNSEQLMVENLNKYDNQYEDIYWKDYNRVIGLLSTKYSFSDSIVRVMILEYLRINKPGKYYSLTMDDKNQDSTALNYMVKPRESINVTLQKFNIQYDIGKDTISSLLFDFELWLQLKEI
jgi:hypothetical protein